MISDSFKNKVHTIVKIAQAQGIVLKYEDWVKTEEAKTYALDTNEVDYYNKIGGNINDEC